MLVLQWAPDSSCVAFASAWQVHLCSVPGMQTRSISMPFDVCDRQYGSKVRSHQLLQLYASLRTLVWKSAIIVRLSTGRLAFQRFCNM